jgi:hypothetical protein
MEPIRSLIESYGLGEILLAVVAGVGTIISPVIGLAVAVGILTAYVARAIDSHGVQ